MIVDLHVLICDRKPEYQVRRARNAQQRCPKPPGFVIDVRFNSGGGGGGMYVEPQTESQIEDVWGCASAHHMMTFHVRISDRSFTSRHIASCDRTSVVATECLSLVRSSGGFCGNHVFIRFGDKSAGFATRLSAQRRV
jgi:hypothetical protein